MESSVISLRSQSLVKRAVLFTGRVRSWHHTHPLNEQSHEVFPSRFCREIGSSHLIRPMSL